MVLIKIFLISTFLILLAQFDVGFARFPRRLLWEYFDDIEDKDESAGISRPVVNKQRAGQTTHGHGHCSTTLARELPDAIREMKGRPPRSDRLGQELHNAENMAR